MPRHGGGGRPEEGARTSRGHGASPVEHGDQSRSFLAPRLTSTMVTQISAPGQTLATWSRSANTHRVVGYACDAAGPTSGTART